MKDTAESNFGTLLRRLRIERKLSQEDLAERAKMSAAAISALERGSRRAPYRSSVDLLADGLCVDAEMRTALHALAERWRKSRALPERTLRAAKTSGAGVPRNNLPVAISSFVGREKELDDLSELIERCRLLTIVGPGGIGKTRLVLHRATQLLQYYTDGVWVIDLSNVGEPEFIVQAVADAIGLRELPNQTIDKTLTAFLCDKKALLILDGSEHLLVGVARLVKDILSQNSTVTFVATSIEPLHVVGEQIYRLGPLADSVRLFVERAREADPGFSVGDRETLDVEALCARLEGIPLAIELACARLSSMTVKQLAGRLRSALTLESKDVTETSRHRTLRETIDWSYQLLSPMEQRALMALSVFSGGSTTDAIRDVALDVADVDDAVESLVDKSLLAVDVSSEAERYRLLDVVREYAREQLQASGDGDAAARRHAAYYAARASMPEAADLSNLRAALEWSLANDASQAARIVHDAAPYWRVHGTVTEARSWIARTLDATSEPEARALLLCRAASFATMQDALAESLPFAREALDIFRSVGNVSGEAEALFRVAEAEHRRGHLDEAEELYRNARAGFATSGDDAGEMICIGNLGMIARQRGDTAKAKVLLEDAIRRATEIGDERLAAESIVAMAWLQLEINDAAEARRLFQRAFDARRKAEDPYGICMTRYGLATVALIEGNRSQALADFRTTLREAQDLQLKDYVARSLHGIAAILASNGKTEDAARLLGLADRLFEESGRELRDSVAYDMAAHSIAASVAEPQRSQLPREGRRMHVDEVHALLG